MLIGIALTLLGLLQFPNLFINKSFDYKSFELYSNGHVELDDDVKKVLDSVIVNLKQSQFYQPKQKFELYFVKGTLYDRLTKLFGVNNIASSKYNKHIYFGNPDFVQSKLIKGESKFEWVNLVQIISHEAVHSQMYTDYSRLGFMKIPAWINEGYCEYISHFHKKNSPNYNLNLLRSKLQETEDDWVKSEFGSMTPTIYLRDRLIMEYLLDVENKNILKIIENENLDPEKILSQMKIKLNGLDKLQVDQDVRISKELLDLELAYQDMLLPIISLKEDQTKMYWFIVSWLKTSYSTPDWTGYYSEEWKEKTKKKGIDCSGFARVMMDQVFQKEISGSSQGILNQQCIRIERNSLKMGDLVFFRAPYSNNDKIVHVGVYLQNGYFVHATSKKSASKGLGLSVNSLQEKHWSEDFVAGGRVKE